MFFCSFNEKALIFILGSCREVADKETKINDDVVSTQDAQDGAMLQQGVDPTAPAPADPLAGGVV